MVPQELEEAQEPREKLVLQEMTEPPEIPDALE